MKDVYKETTRVYDTLGKKYLKDSLKLTPPERAEFAKLIPKKGKLLDVGCGGGRDAKYFVQKGFDVTGVDLSKVMLREARKQVPKAKFKEMDVLDLKFPDNTFDAVWAHAILLHLKRKDVPKALQELKRALKKDGILHVRVKHGKGEALVKEKLSGWNERSYTYFLKSEIISLFNKIGFKVIYSEIVPDELGRKEVKWIIIWGTNR